MSGSMRGGVVLCSSSEHERAAAEEARLLKTLEHLQSELTKAKERLAGKRKEAVHGCDFDDTLYDAATISTALADCPLADPPEGLGFYAIQNNLSSETDRGMLDEIAALTEKNIAVLQHFGAKSPKLQGEKQPRAKMKSVVEDKSYLKIVDDFHQVRSGHALIKYNVKTEASILAKSRRPAILAAYPLYTMRHIRDSLRFKVVVATYRDAFEILRVVVQESQWTVKKLDLEKLLQPKQFGWRFLGADLLIQGQLVECYIV
jgi:hypothetical protein